MAPSNHVRHTAGMTRDNVTPEANSPSKILSTRQNDNSRERDRSGRNGGSTGDRGSGSRFSSGRGGGGGGDEGNSRGGRVGGDNNGGTSTGGRNDRDGSRGDRGNRSGGGRGFFSGRRMGDNDRNGDRSNNDRGRGGGRSDNDISNRSRPLAASSAAPTSATGLPSSAAPSQRPPVASAVPVLDQAKPVNNVVSASLGQAREAIPAAGNTPFIMMPNPTPTPAILLSTVLPDFVSTIPLTTAQPSGPALPGGTAGSQVSSSPAIPDATQRPETSNGINPVEGAIGAGPRTNPSAETQLPDSSPAQQQRGESKENGASMDATTERVLISIGSIVSFAIVCFVVWMIWHTAKKPRRSSGRIVRRGNSPEAPAFYQKIAANIPFFKNRQEASWQKLDEKVSSSAPSNNSAATKPTLVAAAAATAAAAAAAAAAEAEAEAEAEAAPVSTSGVLDNEKVNQPLPTLPRLQTRMSFLPQYDTSPARMGVSPAGISMSPGTSTQSPARSMMNTPQISQLQYDFSGVGTGRFHNEESTISSHQANNSFSSTNAAEFEGTLDSTGGLGGRLMVPMMDQMHNRNELSQQSYDTYNSPRRNDYHASMLSSLSSGFGDGDIIILDQPQAPATAQLSYMQTQAQSSEQYLRSFSANRTSSRASWMSRSNRDTVYTQSSDDSPPRFRTVSSWVNQQTSRVKRAEQRANGKAPPPISGITATGWHEMPPEPQLNMMMDDGQAPRAPDSVLGG